MIVQGGIFHHILTSADDVEKADVIIVFMGAEARIRNGYVLAESDLAPRLILSPAGAAGLKALERKYSSKRKPYKYLVENRAATTFQNALLTGRLIKEHGLKSCILVTDQYHMPRSYLLLKITLAGQGVKIIRSPVATDAFARSPLAWPTREKKRVYNEMIEFWGSMTELVHYKTSGQLPQRSFRENRIISFLRSALLFRLD